MTATLAIARRELSGMFSSPVGWMCLVGFSLISGVFFALMASEFTVMVAQAAYNPYTAETIDLGSWLIQPYFANTAILLLMLAPAVTMRLFAEDRRRGSFELLMASPIGSGQIVLGKYLGAVGFMTSMIAMTAPMMGMLYWVAEPDTGLIACGYAAMWLMGSAFIAVGILTSAMTDNQIVALIMGFGMLLILWLLSTADTFVPGSAGTLLVEISILSHIDQLMKGLLHTSDVAYFVSFIGVILFATTQWVEGYRWR